MKLNINEKKALYTFGCPNHRATVDRLQMRLSHPTLLPESCSTTLQSS